MASIHDLQAKLIKKLPDGGYRPRFAYVAPYLKQAKRVAWDHARQACAPFKDGVKINEAELRITYLGRGELGIYGADNPDSLRGLGFDGVVLDEYADFDPRVWPEIIRPTLSDREGWAVFIGTPRGHNSFYDIYKSASEDPAWYTLMLKASESGILSRQELESVQEHMTEDQYLQEYECSFEAAVQGAYYAKQISQAHDDGRITGVPYEPRSLVWTAWDLGIGDATAIWFAQVVGKEIRIIDYYEASGVDLGHYVREIYNRPYIYAGHILPHDAEAKELGTGKSRTDTLSSLGLRNWRVVPQQRVEDGINAARLMIPRCWFDKRKCDRGIEALKLYRAASDRRFVDPTTRQPILKASPIHDWTSHAADAFRYLALGIESGAPSSFYKKLVYPVRKYV